MASLKRDWVLTQAAFDKLLACLDADRESAAAKYEDLRQALITYFEFRNCQSPEDLADETINRAARRLSEGQEIYTESLGAYFYAVARNVWRERLAGRGKVIPLDGLPAGKLPAEDPDEFKLGEAERGERERRLECLEGCLRSMPQETSALITQYYQGEGGAKVEGRKKLAEALGVPLNALRIRACRVRAKLEECVRGCLRRQAGG